MYYIKILNPKYWDISIDGTPYTQKPRKLQTLKAWNNGKHTFTQNLAFFNGKTATTEKYGTTYNTLQHLRHNGVDYGYGDETATIDITVGKDLVGGHSGQYIENGVIKKTAHPQYYTSVLNGVGILKDGRVFTVQTSHKVSTTSFLTYINNLYKPKSFIICDGGGSLGCYYPRNGYLFAPAKEGTNGRSVASVLNADFKIYPTFTKTLSKKTSTDPDYIEQVMAWQIYLGETPDGVFGANTKSKTIAKQKIFFPKDSKEWDGVVGQKTITKAGLKWKG